MCVAQIFIFVILILSFFRDFKIIFSFVILELSFFCGRLGELVESCFIIILLWGEGGVGDRVTSLTPFRGPLGHKWH